MDDIIKKIIALSSKRSEKNYFGSETFLMVSLELVRRLFLAKISVTLSLSVPLDVEGLQSREVLTEPGISISVTLSFLVLLEVEGLQSREDSAISLRLE